ncbi:MAG: decarboxylase [Gammaproteobacteria bacterium]|nr:decarboxylase [Gammaproteobacteria bacterium]MBK6582949.1 decarboxylase [Gammaproteobacteria bacterium]
MISDGFSIPDARADHWAQAAIVGRAWAAAVARGEDAGKLCDAARSALAEIVTLEDFFAFPGLRLMQTLQERLQGADAGGFAALAQRVNEGLASGAYRHDAVLWEPGEESEVTLAEFLPPSFDHEDSHRPYFEVLIVAAADTSHFEHNRRELRRLRRADDPFIYEVLQAGSFEDAILATLANPDLQAVVIGDGFGFRSSRDAPGLREALARTNPFDPAALDVRDYGLKLASTLKSLRPELDIYFLTERGPELLAAQPEAEAIRRIFYGREEIMEMHLALLDGVGERYETPYFDNLKRYSRKPVGTFHALPVARGKSIFRSHWIRDMGQFYGINLFMAESSATTGGLDSLLEPTGNIKRAQELAARAFGAEHAYFVTNGTSTSNKIVLQALLAPGDIVLIDRNCHKSHHYAMVLSGAQPLYLEAYPMTAYSMYGAVPLRAIKQALLALKAEGKLDRVRMVDLTNCTFDGHMYNPRLVMEQCLAIKPDLIFVWDEAWFGFARFSPFHRLRTGMFAAAALGQRYASAAYREEYAAFRAEAGELDPADPRLLDMHLLPDPDLVRIRVYGTQSTHKSMSALRQGSMILVHDQDFAQVHGAFEEAFFTHTSTSPNLQIIASLDLARRQMELEGYGLVSRSTDLALRIRRQVNGNPQIAQYFRVLSPEEMVPAAHRASGIRDYGPPHGNWQQMASAWNHDEIALDPTRLTLVCGTAGYDGTAFKGLLAERYDIQLNKTSRNSILLQTNINNTRSDVAHIVRVLAEIARDIDKQLRRGGAAARAEFAARVKALMEDVPDLPNFSSFHDAFREDPGSATTEGHMREAFYSAYRADQCEYLAVNSPEMDRRLEQGPQVIAADFVIPYPPGFPIMVPGQVITADTITFMRELDVKEIHGYHAAQGLRILKPEVLAARKR